MKILDKVIVGVFVSCFAVQAQACDSMQSRPVMNAETTQQLPKDNAVKGETMVKAVPPVAQVSKGELNPHWVVGSLRYYALEGGFYGFHGENGERFLLMGIDQSMLQNNAKVKVYGYPMKDIATFQQWGTPFKVLKAELLSAGQDTRNPTF